MEASNARRSWLTSAEQHLGTGAMTARTQHDRMQMGVQTENTTRNWRQACESSTYSKRLSTEVRHRLYKNLCSRCTRFNTNNSINRSSGRSWNRTIWYQNSLSLWRFSRRNGSTEGLWYWRTRPSMPIEEKPVQTQTGSTSLEHHIY